MKQKEFKREPMPSAKEREKLQLETRGRAIAKARLALTNFEWK